MASYAVLRATADIDDEGRPAVVLSLQDRNIMLDLEAMERWLKILRAASLQAIDLAQMREDPATRAFMELPVHGTA